jgi:hypothetical protein
MNPFAKVKAFSRRSQASFTAQQRLEKELYNLTAWIRVADENVSKLSASVGRLKQGVAEGHISAQRLGEAVRELDDEKRRLAIFNEQAASVRERITKLELPSRADAAKRLKEQQALAGIAAERLEVDREISAVVEQLRASLEQRAALSARMREHANALGFDAGADFDTRRFDALRESLPPDLVEKSLEWATSFSGGKPKGSLRCAVLKSFVTTETLGHSGCCSVGDEVFLLPAQAAEFAVSGNVELPKEYAPARAVQGMEAK